MVVVVIVDEVVDDVLVVEEELIDAVVVVDVLEVIELEHPKKGITQDIKKQTLNSRDGRWFSGCQQKSLALT